MNDIKIVGNARLWQRVDELLGLVDDPPREMSGIAGWRAEVRGDQVTAARFHEYRKRVAIGDVSSAPLLDRVRDAVQQPILLLKGPEVAALYPGPAMRPYGDLDLLVPDAVAAENALLAAGFVFAETEGDVLVSWHRHRLPLKFPDMALNIELHRDPGWLTWMTPPSNRELFARAIPSATEVEGIWALPPRDQTLYLAMHSWRHSPYHSLLHLIDIELTRQGVDPDELTTTAHQWGLERVWQSTVRMLDWCFHDPTIRLSPLERIWSTHIRAVRSRTRRSAGIVTRSKSLAAPSLPAVLTSIRTETEQTLTPLGRESFGSMMVRRAGNLRGRF